MGVITLAPTIALTVLGSAHITGVFEMSYGMGAIAIWFSLAHVLMVVVACFATGQWVRHFGITTVPELFKRYVWSWSGIGYSVRWQDRFGVYLFWNVRVWVLLLPH